MTANPDLSLAGRTLRWSFSDGPTANKTYEHTFNADGTLTFREVGSSPDKKAEPSEKPPAPIRYASYEVAPGMHFVSYLAPESGYTLTVLVDTSGNVIYAVASSSKEWYPLKGKLEP